MFVGYGSVVAFPYLRILTHSKNVAVRWGTLNQAGYSNPDVDAIIDKAAAEFDPIDRAHDMQKAFDIAIGKDQAFIPYYYSLENY